MLGMGKNKNKAVPAKHRFEQPYDNHQSEWRKPQGSYITDIDAHKRLNKWLTIILFSSQLVSLALMTLIFICMSYMLLFGNFENVILDDSSRLFCTILEDGSVGIAY